MKKHEVGPPKESAGHFNKILQCWCAHINSYSEFIKGDSLYWYNERATVSTFAQAIAKSGYYCLEEYNSKKMRNNDRDFIGRVDLWAEVEGVQFVFEAKQIWPSLKSKTLLKQITKGVDFSLNQVHQIINFDGKRNGIIFISPYSTTEPKLDVDIKRFIVCCLATRPIFWAYIFPNDGKLKSAKSRKYYPGVFLASYNKKLSISSHTYELRQRKIMERYQ